MERYEVMQVAIIVALAFTVMVGITVVDAIF